MQTEYREFTINRRFGVESEISPTGNVNKKYLANRLNIFELDCGFNKEVIVETSKEGWSDSVNNHFWHVKFDATCGLCGEKGLDGGGWEIASYIADCDDELVAISYAISSLKEPDDVGESVRVNSNCGTHYHVEVNDFDIFQMGCLLSRWVRIEPYLLQACPERRRQSKHCRPIVVPSNDYTPESLWDTIKPQNLAIHNNSDKKVSLNTVGFAREQAGSCYHRNTIELRIPEGTLEQPDILNWGRLFLHFVETSKSRSMVLPQATRSLTEVCQILGLESEHDGTFVLLDEKLLELKRWFLGRLLDFSSLKISVLKS